MPIKNYSLSAQATAEVLGLLNRGVEPGFAGVSIGAAKIWKTDLIKTPRPSGTIGPLKCHRSERRISPPAMKSSPESVKINVRVPLASESISIRVSGCRDPEERRRMSTNKMQIPSSAGASSFSGIVPSVSAADSAVIFERHPIDDRARTRSPTSPSNPSIISGGG
jgi:hypothetical protein